MATTIVNTKLDFDLSSLNSDQYQIVKEFAHCIKDIKVFTTEEIENVLATMEIIMDKKMMESVELGIQDAKAGRVSDWVF